MDMLLHRVPLSLSMTPPPQIWCILPGFADDQCALILIQSSLSEEAMSKTLGHDTTCDVWTALERTHSHDSTERTHTLRDSLPQLQKGSSIESEYGWKFEAMCDQLSAICHLVEESDKIHWFLFGLSSSFKCSPLCNVYFLLNKGVFPFVILFFRLKVMNFS